MITIAIIGFAIGLALSVWGFKFDRLIPYKLGPWLFFCAILIAGLSASISHEDNIPEGFQKIESYSYVTDAGITETLSGTYYKKDDVYYEQKLGKALWIPFGECEYVEVDLPKNYS